MVTKDALRDIDAHWAVAAIGDDREHAFKLASELHAFRSLAGLLHGPEELSESERELLERVATAYEIAAVEDLPVLLQPYVPQNSASAAARSRAGAHRAFELYRAMPIPEAPDRKIFFVLHTIALGYGADRWTDARRWLNEFSSGLDIDEEDAQPWDRRMLVALYRFWLDLVKKEGWEQLAAIEEGVAQLRVEQADYEPALLEARSGAAARPTALVLLALYHWARATEILGVYLAKGEAPGAIASSLDQHFENAASAAGAAGESHLEVLLRWLHLAARQMAAGAIWSAAEGSERIERFIEHLTRSEALFEFLPPQRAALQEQGLLDQAKRAVVVDIPTSGGKTALAEFRILQALNQFQDQNGWVAYVAPTRALVTQIARRLRSDFSSLGLEIEALTSAIEIDSFESRMLGDEGGESSFDILVLTPEKLDLVIRNGQVQRQLALAVIDEAQNIESEDRGLTLELLLATIKRDVPAARFLLLMPYVPNASDLASWLAPDTGASISLGASAWQPNDLMVGLYGACKGEAAGDWSLGFKSLLTSRESLEIEGEHRIGENRPVDQTWSQAKNNLNTLTAAMARSFSTRGTTIGVARTIPSAWSMARLVMDGMPDNGEPSEEIRLVQRFLATEISPDFELNSMLEKGVAVHHAGLSDDARALIEWLAEEDHLKVLCATTTLAQGIDFPVSALFLSSRSIPSRPARDMTAREFWNLAGRAGRIHRDSLGVVGLASSEVSQTANAAAITDYVAQVTEHLVSRIDRMLDELWERGELDQLSVVIRQDQWTSFRSYVAHLWAEKQELEGVLGETEQLLRNTLGYSTMRASDSEAKQQQAAALLEATRTYATELADHPENAILADSTGFSPEGVRSALLGLGETENAPASLSEWEPGHLLAPDGREHLANLVGVMLRIRELGDLANIGNSGVGRAEIARIAQSWVAGETIESIAREYFSSGGDSDLTVAITDTCKALYRTLSNLGSWGISALSKMPTAGIDHENLSEEERSVLNALPAMIYHGVATQSGVLMRMNSAPRSVADRLGERFESEVGEPAYRQSSRDARNFLGGLSDSDWSAAAPEGAVLSGSDYREVWKLLTGQR